MGVSRERPNALLGLLDRLGEPGPLASARSVDLDNLARLRVFQRQQADRGELAIVLVPCPDTDDVVPPREHSKLGARLRRTLGAHQEV